MYGIYTYIPQTTLSLVDTPLQLICRYIVWRLSRSFLHQFFYVSTFRTMCAVPKIALFCGSRTSSCHGMLLIYSLNYFETVPVAPIITGIAVVCTFHIPSISIVKSLYFKIFSASFSISFLSPEIATSISTHVLCSVSRIIMSGLLLGMVLSVCPC